MDTNIVTVQRTQRGWVVSHLDIDPPASLASFDSERDAVLDAGEWAITFGARIKVLPAAAK